MTLIALSAIVAIVAVVVAASVWLRQDPRWYEEQERQRVLDKLHKWEMQERSAKRH